eukprot:COSAG02_NODE_305_length_25176_cov_30.787455_13_plen_184_part_00
MGRQRPATDTFRAIYAGTLERLAGPHRSTNKHAKVGCQDRQLLFTFPHKGIGNRKSRGTADSQRLTPGDAQNQAPGHFHLQFLRSPHWKSYHSVVPILTVLRIDWRALGTPRSLLGTRPCCPWGFEARWRLLVVGCWVRFVGWCGVFSARRRWTSVRAGCMTGACVRGCCCCCCHMPHASLWA